ncbi:hypothetical protein HMI56_007650 [Coelomomyces lativittatus]|nr:hypothetical protein HMI56_007650 [Coelomomyces lativittatus]
MALSSAEPSSSSEPSSHTPLSSFSITLDMNALLECVQLFSSTSTTHESTTQGHPSSSHPPPPPPPPSLHDPSTTTSNKSKFKSSVSNLTKTSVLQLLCQHPDGPLEFIFQDQGLRSHCKLTSYTSPSSPPHSPSSSSSSSSFPSTLPLLLSYSTHLPEYHHVILPSSFLEEALMLVLDQKRCPIQLKVNETGWQMFIAHPLSNDHPHSTPITSTHTNTILTSTHITVHQHAPMLERFQVHQPSAFTYTHLHSCVPGLSVSKKTSLRTNQRGFLNVQCMVVSPHTCFIDYIVAPLVGSV